MMGKVLSAADNTSSGSSPRKCEVSDQSDELYDPRWK